MIRRALASKRMGILVGCFAMLLVAAGCQLAAIVSHALPMIVPAAYSGLQGKSVAVMVWAERSIKIDWPTIQSDVTASLLKKLQDAQAKEKPDDLKDANLSVVSWQSMARYQQNNPNADSQPIAEIAKEVGVQRLIYVEIEQFQTRSDISQDLYLGKLTASLKVIEYDPATQTSKIGYQEGGINIQFPRKGSKEGELNLGDQRTYNGTINELTGKLAWKFYKHEEERELGK